MRWHPEHREAARHAVPSSQPVLIQLPNTPEDTDPVATVLAETSLNESLPPSNRLELRQADDSASGDVFGGGGGGDQGGSAGSSSGGSSSGSSSSGSSSSSSSSSSDSPSSSDSSSSSGGGGATYNIGGTTSTGSSPSSSTSCPAGSKTCSQNSSISSNTLPIVLGVVIPCLVAAVVFIIVIRKHKQRQRREDMNDKHGSLDFGLGEVQRKKGKKGRNNLPEMIVTGMSGEKMLHGKGLSMDLNTLGSPYVIASDLHGKSSFDSASRSMHDDADPYRPVRTASKSPASMPSKSSKLSDQTSLSSEKQGLLGGAATPSSNTPRSASPVTLPFGEKPAPAYNGNSVSRKPVENVRTPPPLPPKPEDPKPASNFSIPRNVDRSSISSRSNIDGTRKSPPPPMPPSKVSSPVHDQNMPADGLANYVNYTDMLGISQGPQDPRGPPPAAVPRQRSANNLAVPQYNDPRRLSGGARPLPPEDPADNAEQRANRIRSFYKEYFDDSKPAGGAEYYGYSEYYEEEYGDDYYDGAAVWDPETGEWVMGGAAPYDEHAPHGTMTPQSRGQPRFRGPAGAHRYTSSSGHSHRSRGQGPRGRPVKKLPPPKPLNNLPTPHLLKDDMTSMPAMEFAPPPSMKDRAQGRSASPSLQQRAYSPSVRAFTPLQSSFKELTAMPSPHTLRKSGTFTALDFAPPPRLRGDGGGSDTASIRSARSGISAMQAHNVRAGNYRLSRVGNANIGTKDDLAASLKPRWDIGR